MQIDYGLARLINRTYATKHVVVPVSQVGQTLTVAMNDPSDLEAAEELAQVDGLRHPRGDLVAQVHTDRDHSAL